MIELLLLSVALSCDAMALSMANGAKCYKLSTGEIVRFSAVYGFFQGFMPLLGFFLGLAFVRFIAQIDHFVAFLILAFLGAKMIKDGLSSEKDSVCQLGIGFKELCVGAVATSIDALAVGITFSFGESNIWLNVSIIALVCAALSFASAYVGRAFGERFADKALIFGGVILCLIGTKILVEHIFF